MNHWQKLGLPVALGICAAFLNWQSISRKLKPQEYVAVKEAIEPGKKFSKDSFYPVSISHTGNKSLANTLIPWDKVSGLVGKYPQRYLGKDSLITHFDLFEANVVPKRDNEVEVKIRLSDEVRQSLPIFVNDSVDLQHNGRNRLTKCRVLSIAREKENYCVRVGAPTAQYDSFVSQYGTELLEKLQLTEHTSPEIASK